MQISSKTIFIRLWNEGALGNRPITWPTIDAAVNSGYAGRVAIRYQGTSGGGPFISGLLIGDLPRTMGELAAQGYAAGDFYAYEDVPTDELCINGEVRQYGELCLLYSTVRKRMRDSFKEGQRWATGVMARIVLAERLEPEDREHIYGLLDAYPKHTVEFTGYCTRVGVLQRKMIIWEVRSY